MRKSVLLIFFLTFTTFLNAQNQTKDTIAENLDEIKIIKEIQTISAKNGNIKVDVANTMLSSTPNTVDLLAKIPTLLITPDKENISIIGKGMPLLYIDRQKVSMEDLNNLSVDDIKTIEIIRNPSAKYESEGRAVILITKKSGKKDGFKTSISETVSLKKYFNNYFGTNSSFKKDKLEFKFNANYNRLNQWESNANDFSIPGENLDSDYRVVVKTPRSQYIFGGGIFYKINDDDYFSFNVSNRYQTDDDAFKTNSRFRQNTNSTQIITQNDSDESRNFLNSFVNYNTKFKNGIQGFTGLQYSDFGNHTENSIFNEVDQSGAEFVQNRAQRFKVNVASARMDLEKLFANDVKIESGLLYLSAHAKTDLAVFDANIEKNDSYLQKEKNLAAYFQFSKSGKKWSYGGGFRVEQTIIDGKPSTNGISVAKNYSNFFPKANWSYAIDSTKTITFNYAKSISRPDYSSTNLNPTYINPYFVFSGNIKLNPTITDEVTLGLQQKENYFGITVYKSANPVYYGFEYDNQQNSLTFKPVNFDKETGVNVLATLPFKYKLWNTTATLVGIWNKIDDNSAILNEVRPYLYYFSEHTFKLKKDLSIALTGFGMTNRKEGVFNKNAYFITNLALTKKFGDNWMLTLSGNDIFHQMNFTEKFTVDGIRSKVDYFTDTREFSVAIRYSFGKIKDSAYKEREIDENTGRIK